MTSPCATNEQPTAAELEVLGWRVMHGDGITKYEREVAAKIILERAQATPSETAPMDIMEGALRNILGWAAGIQEHTKDEASRKVAKWIVEHADAALRSTPSAIAPKNTAPQAAESQLKGTSANLPELSGHLDSSGSVVAEERAEARNERLIADQADVSRPAVAVPEERCEKCSAVLDSSRRCPNQWHHDARHDKHYRESLESTNKNAEYWIDGARQADASEQLICALQAVNAWKNAAYAMADKLDATPSATVTPKALTLLQQAADGLYNGFEPDNQSALWLRINAYLKSGEYVGGSR